MYLLNFIWPTIDQGPLVAGTADGDILDMCGWIEQKITVSWNNGNFIHLLNLLYMESCLVPRPHYDARPMRFGSHGPRKFLRPRQTRKSETFFLTWGGAFGRRRAVNNFSALMKDVQQPWRVQRNEHFYSMHVFIVESRLAFLFHLCH